ncbi:MAG: metallophosphoesterase [Verrucomicrobiae bacterium]|nr:metallophosphoesterase [Verrucomicrobiae bacterium]MCP5544470.1 metallophosphoesterase [Akkermansiaceae bacterium]
MPLRILHTADWQIGKPFASVPDPAKRARLQQERIEAIRRIADIVRERSCDLVLVAGDLFDSPTPTKAQVSAMFHQIGAIGAPVIAIPGNHDFGGAGGPWEQDFVRQEMSDLVPNFTIRRALFLSHRRGGQGLESVRSRSSSEPPDLELVFEQHGTRYTLRNTPITNLVLHRPAAMP